jgi:hypothetical protein
MRVEGKLFNFEKKCPRMNKVKPKFICRFQLPILICANYVGREVKDRPLNGLFLTHAGLAT